MLRIEDRLQGFENGELKGLFGPMSDDVTGSWRELHNDELHKLYSSPSIY
jgi:hypothetical protein